MTELVIETKPYLTSLTDIGQRVLLLEARALQVLASSLDGSFVGMVQGLLATKGHIIVTGMGKSGHVGSKIAATLASTGSPAFFVHPAEASHGDLGMVTSRDVVLALSDSGETPELANILEYCQRRGIRLYGVTRNASSTLAKACQLVLTLPDVEPACPLRLAPTCSTTMMMALGDALAVALMEQRGFRAEDFKQFHPGGQLGRHLLFVRDIMHGIAALPLVEGDTNMGEVIVTMTKAGFGCAGVVNGEGLLVGVITDGDLRRHLSPDLLQLSAGDVMTPSPRTSKADDMAVKALHTMNSKSITALFVVNTDGKPEGIVHLHDCLRAGLV